MWYEVCKQTGIKRPRIVKVVARFKDKKDAVWVKNLLNKLGIDRTDKLIRAIIDAEQSIKIINNIRQKQMMAMNLMLMLPESKSMH